MKTVLIINGHEPYPFAGGRYNQTLFDKIVEMLSAKVNVLTTSIKDGYILEEEHEKFHQADAVIYQFPIYWFDMPAMMKKYIDEVYAHGVFFGMGTGRYGTDSGLMNGKKYMLSTTWNAPEYAFNDADEFMEGKSLDEALNHIHKIHQFVGMEKLADSFGAHNVIKGPDMEADLKKLEAHMQQVLAALAEETVDA